MAVLMRTVPRAPLIATVDVLALAERFGVPLLSAPVEPAPPAEDPAADPATARQHASARRFLRQHLQVAA